MQIQSLSLFHFKNYGRLSLHFSERICILTGRNGSGKTNLLDAIHHAGLLRSAFHRQDAMNIRFGESFYRLEASLSDGEKLNKLVLLVEVEKKKQVLWKEKQVESHSSHLGRFPLLLILPDDSFQMNESAEWRRGIMDNVFSQALPGYVHHLSRFKRILNQRNALLRYFSEGRRYDPLLLDTLDRDLASESDSLFQLRMAHLPALNESLQQEYAWLSGGKEQASLQYESQLMAFPSADLLHSRRQQDLEAGRTTAGLQKDDLVFLLNEKSLKKYGSQGQQKSCLLALKFAQHRFLREKLGKSPCLLLDDVFDKLDEERIGGLLRRICSDDIGQVFISDAREERSRALMQGIPCQFISVEEVS